LQPRPPPFLSLQLDLPPLQRQRQHQHQHCLPHRRSQPASSSARRTPSPSSCPRLQFAPLPARPQTPHCRGRLRQTSRPFLPHSQVPDQTRLIPRGCTPSSLLIPVVRPRRRSPRVAHGHGHGHVRAHAPFWRGP
jgi:hypothetical protein